MMYYKKEKYEAAFLRFSKLEEQSPHYQLGFELGDDGYTQQYTEKFGEPVMGSVEWNDFLDGAYDKGYILSYDKYLEYNLTEFQKELKVLMDKYDVNISFGYGCCDAGIYCKGLDFEIEKGKVE